jgi:acetyl esterase/lipase
MPPPSPTRRELLRGAGLLGAAALLGAPLAACGTGRSTRNLAFSVEQRAYGTDPLQTGELTLPLLGKPTPLVVLIHGGYWRTGFTKVEMADLAQDLARVGYACWNIDYRRVGDLGGGWTGTLLDVATGIDKLAEIGPEKGLDLAHVALMGHSAGAQLALWAAARAKAPPNALGTPAKITPKGVVSLSGVLDLTDTAHTTSPGGEAELKKSLSDFLGGPPEAVPDRYAAVSPMALLPIGVPQLLLHGTKDDRVSIQQSRAYVAAAKAAGDQVDLIELLEVDHFEVVESSKNWWDAVINWLGRTIGDPTTA